MSWVGVSTPRRSFRRSTATERVTRPAKRSVKQLGDQAASQTLGPATRSGPGSTPTRNWLVRARQQIALEAGGKAQAVDVIAVHTVPDGGTV